MKQTSRLILVTGAANSGKSEWAEFLAEASQRQLIYLATAQKNESDQEWMAKIAKHQQRRSSRWQTWEVPQQLPSNIDRLSYNSCVLIDSLGTWVTNWLETEEELWQEQVNRLMESLARSHSEIIVVAEETGWGVVPAYELGRLFRSRLGKLTRQIGQLADSVYLVVGGYAVEVSKIGVNLQVIKDDEKGRKGDGQMGRE